MWLLEGKGWGSMSSSGDSSPSQFEDRGVGDRAGGTRGCPHRILTIPSL